MRLISCRRLYSILVLLGFILLTTRAGVKAQTATESIGVYYVGPEDAIAAAIDLAAPYLVRVEQPDPDLAQVIVINNAPILEETLRIFGNQIQERRMGLVLFCGPYFPTSTNELGALLGFSAFTMEQTETVGTVQISEVEDVLHSAITWASAPKLHAQTIISNPNLLQSVMVTEAGNTVIHRVRGREQTQGLIVGGWFSDLSNRDWQTWPYFPYLIYRLISDAAGAPHPLSFANYPPSPVPKGVIRWGLFGVGAGVLVGALGFTYLTRRYLFIRPDLARHPAIQDGRSPAARSSHWSTAGFQRPLAGLIIAFTLGTLLIFPVLRLTLKVTGDLIVDAQALSNWRTVGRWLELLWLVVDAGVGIATVRFFSALHIQNRQQAFQYIQFYVWWQLLSGAAQLGVICLGVATGLAGTVWVHISYFLIFHALTQFPGIFQVFLLFFRATQRTDYEQILRLLETFGTIAVQMVAVIYLTRWGSSRPPFGAGLGGVLGLTAGWYGMQCLLFGIGLALARRQGYTLSAFLLPTFDSRIVRRSLSYGLRSVPGSLAVPLAALVRGLIAPAIFGEPGQALAQWTRLWAVTASFDILLGGFYRDLLPALSEALHNGYKTLFRYLISQSVRNASWFSAFWCAALLGVQGYFADSAVASPFIPLLIWGALRWLTYLPEQILLSADRPWLASAIIVLEQAVCVAVWLAMPAQAVASRIVTAYLLSLGIAGILGWVLVWRTVMAPRIYGWQSFIVPVGCAYVVYFLLRTAGTAITLETEALTAWIVPALWLLALLLYGFCSALLGGWDLGSLHELKQAARMSSIAAPYAWLLQYIVQLGARISPLHNRFPITLYAIAAEEAQVLSYIQKE